PHTASASWARNGTAYPPHWNGPKRATGYSNPVDTSPRSAAHAPGTASPSQSKTPDSRCATPSHGYTGQDSPSRTTWGRLSTSWTPRTSAAPERWSSPHSYARADSPHGGSTRLPAPTWAGTSRPPRPSPPSPPLTCSTCLDLTYRRSPSATRCETRSARQTPATTGGARWSACGPQTSGRA